MELKKSPKADLQNKKKYFMQIGIVLSLLLVIGLFSWSQSEKVIEVVAQEAVAVEQEVAEITVQEDKRPPAPVKTQAVAISEVLNIVKNDAKIEQDLSILDMDMMDQIAVDASKFGGTYTGEAETDEDTPIFFAEEMPTFQGGDLNKFRAWCQSNLRYPPIALDNGVQGTVHLQFVVERDGTIKKVTVVRGADRELDAAAVKIVMSSPKWTPGKNRGKAVRVTYNMPIQFQLEAM